MPECQSTPINDEKLHSGAIWHVQEPPFSPIDVNQSREDSIAAEQGIYNVCFSLHGINFYYLCG